jgi:hypothetical protein
MAQGSDTEVLVTAATLREQAALARRLVRGVSGETVWHSLSELADQLEAEASALDDEQARFGTTVK